MTAPGRYAAGDGSFAKSAGGAAARGGVLIAVAIALGLIILRFAYDDGDDSAVVPSDDTAADDTSSDDDTTVPGDDDDTGDDDDGSGDDDTDTSTTLPLPTETRPPGEVRVVIANGVGESGLAAVKKDELITFGYVVAAENAINRATPTSVIYYVDTYGADAAAVAAALGAPASIIDAAPPDVHALVENSAQYEDHHIFVIQGQDRLLG